MQGQIIEIQHDQGCTKLILRNDGIVQVEGDGINYDLKSTKEVQAAIKNLTSNTAAPILILSKKFTLIDTKTREYLSTPEANEHATAKAFVISSLPQKLLLNFLIKVQKPGRPTRFFSDVEAALKWLKEISQ